MLLALSAPAAAEPSEPAPLRFSVRHDALDLAFRRLTLQAEVAVAGPFAIEVAPSWIFGSAASGLDEQGFSVAANAVFYLAARALRGLWLKAHFAYENFRAVATNPHDASLVSAPARASSAVLGVLFGDTWVIPRSGGFTLSGGLGVGVATAPKIDLGTALGTPKEAHASLYEGLDRVRLLGSLALGVAF